MLSLVLLLAAVSAEERQLRGVEAPVFRSAAKQSVKKHDFVPKEINKANKISTKETEGYYWTGFTLYKSLYNEDCTGEATSPLYASGLGHCFNADFGDWKSYKIACDADGDTMVNLYQYKSCEGEVTGPVSGGVIEPCDEGVSQKCVADPFVFQKIPGLTWAEYNKVADCNQGKSPREFYTVTPNMCTESVNSDGRTVWWKGVCSPDSTNVQMQIYEDPHCTTWTKTITRKLGFEFGVKDYNTCGYDAESNVGVQVWCNAPADR